MFEAIYVIPGDPQNGKKFTVYDVKEYNAETQSGIHFLVFKDGMWVYEFSGHFIPSLK